MVDFLNQNPIIIGVFFIVLFGIELWILIFRYDRFLAFLRRKPYASLFFSTPESRLVAISATLMFFVTGLAITAVELGIFSRRFWFAILAVSLINFLGMLVRHKWQKWRKGKHT